MVFVLAFILLRLQFTENQLNGYLALGYALLAIVLWRKEDRESNASGLNMNHKESTEIEMSLLNNLDK